MPATPRYARTPARRSPKLKIESARARRPQTGETGWPSRSALRSAPVMAKAVSSVNLKVGPTRVISSTAAPGSLPTGRFAAAADRESRAPPVGTSNRSKLTRPRVFWTVVSSPGSSTSRHGWVLMTLRRGQPRSVNSITLVEATLEFVRLFVNEVIRACQPTPLDWAIDGGMAELTSDNANNRLAAGTPAQGIFLDQEPASSDGFYFGPLRQRDTPAGVVAYEVLLKRVYQHFGRPRAAIPFIRNGAVDEDLIKTINPPAAEKPRADPSSRP
jgi:hypothetical protein